MLLLLPLLLVRVSASPSITASPTNDTLALTQNVGNLRFILNDTQTPFSTAINLAPLLPSLAELDYQQFQVRKPPNSQLMLLFPLTSGA